MDAVETPTAKPRSRKPSAPQSRKAANRVKASLLLSAETSLKLDVAATLAGLDRSSYAEKVLAAAVRHVVISLRQTGDGVGIGEEAAA